MEEFRIGDRVEVIQSLIIEDWPNGAITVVPEIWRKGEITQCLPIISEIMFIVYLDEGGVTVVIAENIRKLQDW